MAIHPDNMAFDRSDGEEAPKYIRLQYELVRVRPAWMPPWSCRDPHEARDKGLVCCSCGNPEADFVFVKTDLRLCWNCAESVANHWWMIDGPGEGKWLTWPNARKSSGLPAGSKKRVYERDAYRCRYCRSYKDLSIDHVIPVIQGGDNDFDNLVTCCRKCNSSKGGRTPDEAGMTVLQIEESIHHPLNPSENGK